MIEPLEELRLRLLARFPGAQVAVLPNPGPAAQHSLVLGGADVRAIAEFLRDDGALALDHCSNVTGVDWPERVIVETSTASSPDPAGGPDKVTEVKTQRVQPGYLEVVYHLFSVARRHGPLVIRTRTGDRKDRVSVPSLTPVWRSAEFQEREVFDLFGVVFDGHPDLRRLLMWDGYKDHPMRKDYVEPEDYDWEPTPHGDLLAKVRALHPAPAPAQTEGPKP